jgi:hypothetical protein
MNNTPLLNQETFETDASVAKETRIPKATLPLRVNTFLAVQRVKDTPYYSEPRESAPYGSYFGYTIIGRQTKINGGVYLGGGSREAILIDDSYPADQFTYDIIYYALEKRLTGIDADSQEKILKTIFDLVREILPFDLTTSNQISSAFNDDKPVSLCRYIEQKAGVCRHQAILAAYLIERLIREKKIRGNVTAERNSWSDAAHAWVRFISPDTKEYIIDPAQGYVGLHDQAPKGSWPYDDIVDPEDFNIGRGVFEAGPNGIIHNDADIISPQPDLGRISLPPPAAVMPHKSPYSACALPSDIDAPDSYTTSVPKEYGEQFIITLNRGQYQKIQLCAGSEITIILAQGDHFQKYVTLTMPYGGNLTAVYWNENEQKVTQELYAEESLKIGRDTSANIPINDLTISLEHCTIEIRKNGIYIVDNSTNGTIIRLHVIKESPSPSVINAISQGIRRILGL